MKRFELFEAYYCVCERSVAYFIPIGIQDESDMDRRIINAIVITHSHQVIKGVFRCYCEYGFETVKELGFNFTPRCTCMMKKFRLGKIIDCDNE